MKRKDCDNAGFVRARNSAHRPARWIFSTVSVALVVGALSSRACAESVRLWPSAVVVDDTICLADLCELTGFDVSTERSLARLAVAEAPPSGGSKVIHLDMVRSALAAHGANMALVRLGGAMQCAVTRPSRAVREVSVSSPSEAPGVAGRRETSRANSTGAAGAPAAASALTLRQAVVDHLNGELARYGGRAELTFDRTAGQVLDLSGPAYRFNVRRRSGPPLGLVQLGVDVLADGVVVQTVPLVVQVSMTRRAVVARRAINQGAALQASDVELRSLSFARLDKLGLGDAAQTIGQRAKRFISAGSLIEPVMLESVPLVARGQFVTLTSVVGSVRVVTAAKALREGLLGETITVRDVDKGRVEFDAVVIGPGAVRIGPPPAMAQHPRLVMGDRS
jgi:flagella basal body P-ring formation protein FlgA